MADYSNSVASQDRASAMHARRSRRTQIEAFFREHIGERFGTNVLHQRFGTSFRARVSEVNRDTAAQIRILNKTSVAKAESGQSCEPSVYWAEFRESVSSPAAETESSFMRKHREEREQAAPLFARVQP
jgi:hypothetical protein